MDLIAFYRAKTMEASAGDKFTRLASEGWSPAPAPISSEYTPPAAPILVGLDGAGVAPILVAAPEGASGPTNGGGIVAGLPRRPDDAIASGGVPGATVGAPLDVATLYQAPARTGAVAGVAFDVSRAVLVSVLATLVLVGVVAVARDKRKRGR